MRQKSNYRILSLVGRGQFGQVFAAIERNSGTLVALKELKQKHLSTSSFLRELNFLVTLNHFNIVTCKALEHYQGNRYLVMDYCEGGTLRSLLDKPHKQDLLGTLKLISNILSGLKFAHDRGIIHRDIKPENIMLKTGTCGWTAHVSDFGIAKLHQEIDQSTTGNSGSPAYMAPEQFYGQYSYSCDLYAVGIILYELVVGDRPFSGMPKELLSAHLNQPVVIPKQIPFMLRSAIAKSLQKLPHRRFQSAAEMLKALQLVQTVLQASQIIQTPNTASSSFDVLNCSSQISLDYQVSHLAIAAEQVYLASGNRLYLRQYSDSSLVGQVVTKYTLTLEQSIRTLEINSLGCFLSTASSIYLIHRNTSGNEFFFVNKTLLPIAVFPTDDLVQGVDYTGSWLVASYLPSKSKTPAWEIFKLPNCQQRRSQVNRKKFEQIFALDRHHGLGIYYNQAHNTELHLFDRRGNWLANFTLKIQFDLVAYNPLFSRQLLVTEKNQARMAILIDLKKLSVERIPLDITPNLITCCTSGYLLSDRQGKMILLDHQGDCIKRFQVQSAPEFEIMAIAVSDSQLLIASASASQSQLKMFPWKIRSE